MLATPATALPAGEDWLHEVKWDGMRILADARVFFGDPSINIP